MLFLDMDGILADFHGGICKAHNRPDPFLDPANYGIWNFNDIWKMPTAEFYEPCGYDFWFGLSPTLEADGIVEWALDTYGQEQIAILTAPVRNPGCIEAKRDWMKKHYPKLNNYMIFTAAKDFVAGPGKNLIDDSDKNIDGWIEHGGTGFLWPRPWNRLAGQEGPRLKVGWMPTNITSPDMAETLPYPC